MNELQIFATVLLSIYDGVVATIDTISDAFVNDSIGSLVLLRDSVSKTVRLGDTSIEGGVSRSTYAHIGTGGNNDQHVDITVDDNGAEYSLVATDNNIFLFNEDTSNSVWQINPTYNRGTHLKTGTGGDTSQH